VTERPAPGIHRSVFARLVAIMAATAASLIGMVGIFFWLVVSSDAVTRGHDVQTIHSVLLTLVLAFVAGVVFTTHLVLRRLLAPLRGLQDGVARLSAGHLDVVVPGGTGDEFGLLSDAFNEMVARVRQMVGARDQLLLDVSHELRSPLTRMKVALELSPPGDHRARMAADLAEMEAMIGELLEMERLRDGGGLAMAPHDVGPILHEVAARFDGQRPGVAVVAPAGRLQASLDPDRIRTVISNLVDNAVKYSLPESGPVTVSAGRTGDQVTIQVADEGPGVPEDDLANLFEPFFRVDRSRSKKTGGYGLGLSICRRIVEAHGGTLEVQNRVPRGACFTIRLRAGEAAPGR
jgi:signal transduction histidine kinase